MSHPDTHTSQTGSQAGAAGGFLQRLREWWGRRGEFAQADSPEFDRMAGEFQMTSRELQDLIALGPKASDLLYQRMAALGVGRSDVDRVAYGLMQDLEKTCSRCAYKGACEADLQGRPDDAAWVNYCPNATSLDSVMRTKGRFII